MTAEPKLRAGLIPVPVTEMVTICAKKTAVPIAAGTRA